MTATRPIVFQKMDLYGVLAFVRMRLDPSKLTVALGVGVVLALAAFHFRQTLLLLLSDSYWSDAMQSKEGAGTILAAFVTGICMIIAAASTVLIYNFQQRHESLRSFLQWLAEFNGKFHEDTRHSKTRELLARRRPWIRQQLALELLMDKAIARQDVLSADMAVICTASGAENADSLDWGFLRDFTDYLYFFEQVLAFGEALSAEGSPKNAATFVNHFGWFLRSLCGSWGSRDHHGKQLTEEDGRVCQRLFILYLATNRYRRLAQVALLFCRTSWEEPEGSCDFYKRINAILEEHTSGAGMGREQLVRHWTRIVGTEKGWMGH